MTSAGSTLKRNLKQHFTSSSSNQKLDKQSAPANQKQTGAGSANQKLQSSWTNLKQEKKVVQFSSGIYKSIKLI